MINLLSSLPVSSGEHLDLGRGAWSPPRATRSTSRLDFSLVVPTYNERENLEKLFARLDRILRNHRFEVILVDDDSPDGTWAEAKVHQHRYKWLRVIRRCDERGLSSAVICGFRHARGKIVGVMDADLQHDDARLPELLRRMKHADFAVATRRAVGGSDGKWSWPRRYASWTATTLTRIIARVPLSDPMSGFFAMRRDLFTSIDDWALRPRGYKVLLYLYSLAAEEMGRENVRVSEIGYKFSERRHGRSKFSGKVIFEFIAMLFQLRLHSRHSARA